MELLTSTCCKNSKINENTAFDKYTLYYNDILLPETK
jgi:hypothetical protein